MSVFLPTGVHGTISVLGPPVPRHRAERLDRWAAAPSASEVTVEEYAHPAVPRKAAERSPESLRCCPRPVDFHIMLILDRCGRPACKAAERCPELGAAPLPPASSTYVSGTRWQDHIQVT